MPVRFERDDARRRLVVTLQGPFALTEFLAVLEMQRRGHTWTYGILYDLRGMTGEVTLSDFRESFAQAEQAKGRRGPIAILATDPTISSRAHTFATLGRAALTVGVFRDLADAE